MRPALVGSILALSIFSIKAWAATSSAQLQSCYHDDGKLETTQEAGKKVTVYKDQAEVASDCNKKVVAAAQAEKNTEKLLELASIIGRNSNWPSALPVYVIAAKKDAKTICTHKDSLDALEGALARSGDEPEAKNAKQFMTACWPRAKAQIVALLKPDQNSYVKDNVCAFLKEKNAMPTQKELCSGV